MKRHAQLYREFTENNFVKYDVFKRIINSLSFSLTYNVFDRYTDMADGICLLSRASEHTFVWRFVSVHQIIRNCQWLNRLRTGSSHTMVK